MKESTVQTETVETELTEAQQKDLQKEVQRQFNMFKRRFKSLSKSELVATIWEQGMEFKKLQGIAQQLFEENKALKEASNESN